MNSNLIIPHNLWQLTWAGLAQRGSGKVEAFCVWAGDRTSSSLQVKEVIFLDDLPGVQGFPLFHKISREAVARLFEILKSKSLDLIADVHTHPEEWVDLSQIDQENPLEYRVGFYSVVLPYFGKSDPSLDLTGLHRYTGSLKWKTLSAQEKIELIQFT